MVDDDANFILEYGRAKLYLGNFVSARDIMFLKSSNVNHVINMAIECQIPIEMYNDAKISWRHFKIYDIEADANTFKASIEELADYLRDKLESGSNVLVHCVGGISRSASLVIYFNMKYNRTSFVKSYELVKKMRPVIEPNDGFHRMLKELDNPEYSKFDNSNNSCAVS